jgi:predicted ATP-grasp superfamily ATP-dependent carboligase
MLMVGASCRALANSAVRDGWSVVSLDVFADRDLHPSIASIRIERFPESIVTQVDRLEATHCMLAGGMENLPEVLAFLEQRMHLLAPSSECMRRLRSVEYCRMLAQRASLKFPRIRWREWGAEKPESWLWKPCDSAGGYRILRGARPREGNGYWQEFIPGEPKGCVLLCDRKQTRLLGMVESLQAEDWDGPSEFAYRGSIVAPPAGDTDVLTSPWAEGVIRLGEILRREMDYRGLLQADFIWNVRRGAYLLELNPRWTASMDLLQLQRGSDLVALHCQAHEGWGLPLAIHAAAPAPIFIGKAILYGDRDRSVESDQSNRWMQQTWNPTTAPTTFWLADIPWRDTFLQRGRPWLTIYATGKSRGEVMEKLHAGRGFCLQ